MSSWNNRHSSSVLVVAGHAITASVRSLLRVALDGRVTICAPTVARVDVCSTSSTVDDFADSTIDVSWRNFPSAGYQHS